jgi:hypothetical protein
MSMEKKGVVQEGVTPPEEPRECCKAADDKSSTDHLADDHAISRLIQGMGRRCARPMIRPQGGT